MTQLPALLAILALASPAAAQVWTGLAGSLAQGGVSGDSFGTWGYAQRSAMALDGQGRPALAWIGAYGEVYFRRWNGTDWEELAGSATGDGVGSMPSGATGPYDIGRFLALDPQGQPVLVWPVHTGPDSSEIRLRRWSGTAWEELGGSDSPGGLGGTAGHSFSPCLAVDAQGRPTVAWVESPTSNGTMNIYCRRWTGSSWEALGTSASGNGVSGSVMSAQSPALALTSSGDPVIAWRDHVSNTNAEIFLRKWDGAGWVELGGSGSGAGVSASPSTSSIFYTSFPQVAVDGSNRILVLWQDEWNGAYHVYLRRWSGLAWEELGGSATGGGLSPDPVPGSSPVHASFAITSWSLPVVTWEHRLATGAWEIRVREWTGQEWIDAAGSCSPQGIALSPASHAWGPSIAVGPDGSRLLTWMEEWTNPDTHISGPSVYVARRRDTAPQPDPPQPWSFDNTTPLPDGTAPLQEGGFTLRTRVVDPDADVVQLDVEVRPLGTTFTGTPTLTSAHFMSGWVIVTPIPGLAIGQAYHAQVRAFDSHGHVSSWVPMPGSATPPSPGPAGPSNGNSRNCSAAVDAVPLLALLSALFTPRRR